MTTRHALGAIGLALLLCGQAAPVVAQSTTMGSIARDPVKFDRRTVIVVGTVGMVGEEAGRLAFDLIGEGITMRVIAPRQPAVKTGDRVEVEGVFSLAGNQIDAFRVSWR